LGHVCAPQPYSDAIRIVHDYLTICAPAPLQAAAATAMQLPDSYYAGQRADYHWRRDRMMGILNRFGFSATPPEGAYYVMSDFAGKKAANGHQFTNYLITEVGIAVVPASSFYRTPGLGTQQIRWAYAKKAETFAAIEERLATHF